MVITNMNPSTGGRMAVPDMDVEIAAVPSRDAEMVVHNREGMADKEMEAARYPGMADKGIPAAGRRQGMVRGGIITRAIIRSPKRMGRLQGRRHRDDTGADRRGRARARPSLEALALCEGWQASFC